ncbi:MAG: hypothetical protein ACK5GX_03625 [Bacteroidota bacterium]
MKIKVAVVFLALLTVYMLAIDSRFIHPLINPVLLIGFTCLLISIIQRQTPAEYESEGSSRIHVFTIGFILSVCCVVYASYVFAANPIDISKSDILPLLKEVYYTRLVSGEFVYNRVHGYDYVNWVPNYLPMHWLPFVPAFYFGFDPRYIPLFFFLAVQFLYLNYLSRLNLSAIEKYIKASIPYLLVFVIAIKQKSSFAHTVELLIAGYYLLVAYGLTTRNKALLITGISCALLSRYALLFFIPIHLIYEWKRGTFSFAVKTYAAVFCCILLVYVLPFLTVQPGVFLEGASAYDVAALGEWKGQSWQNPGDLPYQIFQGYGMAAWYYTVAGSNQLLAGITALKYSLFLVMVSSICMYTLSIRIRQFFSNNLTALLYTLLVLFFLFVPVPYNYLYWNILFLLPFLVARFKWITT